MTLLPTDISLSPVLPRCQPIELTSCVGRLALQVATLGPTRPSCTDTATLPLGNLWCGSRPPRSLLRPTLVRYELLVSARWDGRALGAAPLKNVGARPASGRTLWCETAESSADWRAPAAARRGRYADDFGLDTPLFATSRRRPRSDGAGQTRPGELFSLERPRVAVVVGVHNECCQMFVSSSCCSSHLLKWDSNQSPGAVRKAEEGAVSYGRTGEDMT
jgi:hypothetical protein